MNKSQFLAAVRQRLAGLPKGDVDRYLDYIREMIDDRMEDGHSEEEAVATMGSAEYVASQLLLETPVQPHIQAAPIAEKRSFWQIALIALGAPVWLPLLFGAVVAVLGLAIGAAAGIFGLYCAAGALVATGFALLITGGFQFQMPDLLFLLAAGCLLIGLGLLMILGLNWLNRILIRLVKWLWSRIPARIPKKEVKS